MTRMGSGTRRVRTKSGLYVRGGSVECTWTMWSENGSRGKKGEKKNIDIYLHGKGIIKAWKRNKRNKGEYSGRYKKEEKKKVATGKANKKNE